MFLRPPGYASLEFRGPRTTAVASADQAGWPPVVHAILSSACLDMNSSWGELTSRFASGFAFGFASTLVLHLKLHGGSEAPGSSAVSTRSALAPLAPLSGGSWSGTGSHYLLLAHTTPWPGNRLILAVPEKCRLSPALSSTGLETWKECND